MLHVPCWPLICEIHFSQIISKSLHASQTYKPDTSYCQWVVQAICSKLVMTLTVRTVSSLHSIHNFISARLLQHAFIHHKIISQTWILLLSQTGQSAQCSSVTLTFIIDIQFLHMFVLRFYGPVNPMGSCRARSVYLTTRLLGRLNPLSG